MCTLSSVIKLLIFVLSIFLHMDYIEVFTASTSQVIKEPE